MSKRQILSHKKVFASELFYVEETKFTLPNGKTKTHQNAIRRPTVSVFPITDQYEIYLITQYRYLLEKEALEAMAGFINKKETSLSAAKRELQEEMGISASHWEEIARIEMTASVFRAQSHLFLAKDLEFGKTNFDDDEHITILKMPIEEAAKKVARGEINHAPSMIGILLLDRLRRENKL
ncbi:MAG: NUDIX hydrolase [Candidatus Levybacteria bacterium]|nr:NUDIX hydrolase [Candidatus Levybacteria bacterium]